MMRTLNNMSNILSNAGFRAPATLRSLDYRSALWPSARQLYWGWTTFAGAAQHRPNRRRIWSPPRTRRRPPIVVAAGPDRGVAERELDLLECGAALDCCRRQSRRLHRGQGVGEITRK